MIRCDETALKQAVKDRRARDKKSASSEALFLFGGVDGARTRDPRRDRPVF